MFDRRGIANSHAAVEVIMKPKKPVQRAIEILIQNTQSGDSVKGIFYANDFGDGATEHLLDGHFTDSRGETRRFFGRLTGYQFGPVERRGAPRKIARDVAIFLAYQWHLGAAKRKDAQARPQKDARERVMNLWAERGFTGASEETHLRKRLKAGAAGVHGLSLMRFECLTPTPDGVLIAALESAFDMSPGDSIGIDGPGWFWRYGMEEAIEGAFAARVTLTQR